MRAGVQTGDRIIKVNGTLVTHSNHTEVVELIKSGSYVALTVLGRPPGLAQVPLPEAEHEMLGISLSSPNSPAFERPYSPLNCLSSLQPWDLNSSACNQRADVLQKKFSKEQQELQEAVSGGDEDNGSIIETDCALAPKGDNSTDLSWSSTPVSHTLGPVSPDSHCPKDSSCASPKSTPRNSFNSCHSPEAEDGTDLDPLSPVTVSSRPPYRFGVQIIGAEDDCFDSDQEQTNGQCNSFNSIDQLKCRPAHLAAFLHHVISQFDPAPVLCYLYADFYKQTNPKETRRVFLDFHTIFMDRAANLKVPVPESVSSDLNRRRTDLIPEEINRQYVQTLQDSLFPDILKNLEDFRQKRSMGLTVAEVELNRLDQERVRDRVTLERECSYAENIISKIDDILVTTQPTEEEKCRS
ncbi:rho guanine nucleotide exchange factor 12, partial [Nematolebias whitei]|uniref:rho guanine nucleotide exchange factor 12 n=1 Tax=Nematolebias whitei TaxID=451745 RepID=UPI0018987BA3